MNRLLHFFAFCVLGLDISATAEAQTIITIDVPGAGTGANQGTVAFGINTRGAIIGNYVDSSYSNHGFLRAKNGVITTFDAPGAGIGDFNGTVPRGLNDAGAITGFYSDRSGVLHGFLRALDGTITTFDAPGAGTGSGQGTIAANINAAGEISGAYIDVSNVSHGFLRARDGTIAIFDAPGAGIGAGEGTSTTFFSGLNNAGTITGPYVDAAGVNHTYVRAPSGVITTVDAPGAGGGSGQGTVSGSINASGEIIGEYADASNEVHGFLRAKNGAITTFDAPGAGTGGGGSGCFLAATCQGTYPQNINPRGDIDGEYVDVSGINHGFVQPNHGTMTSFDAPGAGTGSGQGTIPFANNAADAITGFYIDAAGAVHGFLRTEHCHEKGEEEDCEAADSETITSADSALQVDELISTRDRAEIAAEFGLNLGCLCKHQLATLCCQ